MDLERSKEAKQAPHHRQDRAEEDYFFFRPIASIFLLSMPFLLPTGVSDFICTTVYATIQANFILPACSPRLYLPDYRQLTYPTAKDSYLDRHHPGS